MKSCIFSVVFLLSFVCVFSATAAPPAGFPSTVTLTGLPVDFPSPDVLTWDNFNGFYSQTSGSNIVVLAQNTDIGATGWQMTWDTTGAEDYAQYLAGPTGFVPLDSSTNYVVSVPEGYTSSFFLVPAVLVMMRRRMSSRCLTSSPLS